MKKIFFLTGMYFCLQFADAQVPFAKHYWHNPESVNYTLSPPTSKGEWIVVMARAEQNTAAVSPKNTIAVFKFDAAYNTLDSSVIGHHGIGDEDEFDINVEFEVHSIVEVSDSDNEMYVLCGSINRDKDTVGMVAVLNSQLELVELRQYEKVKTFYFVHAENNYYYVCGETTDGKGIALQDNILLIEFRPKVVIEEIPCTQKEDIDIIKIQHTQPFTTRVLGVELHQLTKKYNKQF